MMYNTNFVLNLFQEFFLRQVHNLVADFIVQMPLKVFPSSFFVQFLYICTNARLHILVLNIGMCVLQIKELRNRGDEAARIIIAHAQEGLEPPSNLRRDFEQFLMMVLN